MNHLCRYHVCPGGIIENVFNCIWCKTEFNHVIISPLWPWGQVPCKLWVVNLGNDACKLQDLLLKIAFSNCNFFFFLPQAIYPNIILRNAVLEYVCGRAYTNAVSSIELYLLEAGRPDYKLWGLLNCTPHICETSLVEMRVEGNHSSS